MIHTKKLNWHFAASAGLVFLLSASFSAAQSLPELMKQAAENYPAISFQKAKAEQAASDLALEKNTLMPSLDAAYQANLATYNNITGMNYPGQLIPISGPPSTDNFNEMVPGTAASLLMKWTPITFGQRAAGKMTRELMLQKELAGIENEILRVQYEVGSKYFDLLATEELIKAFEKNIERTEFNLRQVRSLVISGIRPAVDSIRFQGELSKAKSELINLKNLLQTQQIQLAELIVSENELGEVNGDFFTENLPQNEGFSTDIYSNPMLKMAQSELMASNSSLAQLRRAWTPKLEFWGTGYARGSGIDFNGVVNKSEGWGFSRYNYGLGVQVVLPILDLTKLKIKKTQQEAQVRTAESYLKQIEISLKSREGQAASELQANLALAAEVPMEYQASESAFKAIQSRYKAGLVDYSELILAQNDLLFAEAKLKSTYLNAWKALLKQAAIQGDMESFLTQIQN